MRCTTLLASLLAALPVTEAARGQPFQDGAGRYKKQSADDAQQLNTQPDSAKPHDFLMPQKPETQKYAVNGSGIPEVDFDIGESYAGLMPIGNDTSRSLYFWLFPTTNDVGKDTVTIWLNGGPYCSSFWGLFQENGPFLQPPGVLKPLSNSWSWHKLTNIIYVDQPVGAGFSQGDPTKTHNEVDLANDFIEFFKNIVNTFELHGKKIYIAGESYAGVYIPNIAYAMFDANNTEYFNLQGTLIYDGAMGSFESLMNAHVISYMDRFKEIFILNDTFMADIRIQHKDCGFEKYVEDYFKFPPAGPFPAVDMDKLPASCDIYDAVAGAMNVARPCFSYYNILTTCPLLFDVFSPDARSGYSGPYFFARPDVQKAINAPIMDDWEPCGSVLGYGLDQPNPPGHTMWTVYPSVIERSKRTLYVHGAYDFRIIDTAVLMVFQNMTWGGAQGFTEPPSDPLYVPWQGITDPQMLYGFPMAGFGEMGRTRTERGFTWVSQWGAGHEVPMWTPGAAYVHLQYLLGMIDSLNCKL